MRIAITPSRSDPILVHRASFVDPAGAFKRTPAVIVGSGVIRIGSDERAVFGDGFVQAAKVGQLHCGAITQEAVVRVLAQERANGLKAC